MIKKTLDMDSQSYSPSLFKYTRLKTRQIHVGMLSMGGDSPIRVQSMTTTDTNDVEGSAEQSMRIIDAGGEIVRLTTQGEREAKSIGKVRELLNTRGYRTPLVADVHFNPKAALTAAAVVEAVRINPGNYTGEAKRFNSDADTLDDEKWHKMIVEKLSPLVEICKEHGTALRIGVNHGSLSDRVMAKYGDTPEGMVASCTEYLDALEELGFQDVAISIKSSNTRVMVETVRLLAATLRERKEVYPLHLGVTEAGSDAEGRIKSAAGIGALLNDGIGDTIRVSLTEAPEAEIPVAQALVAYCSRLERLEGVPEVKMEKYSPFAYRRRVSVNVGGIGGNCAPIVVCDGNIKADWVKCGENKIQSGSGESVKVIPLSLGQLLEMNEGDLALLRTQRDAVIVGQCMTGNYQAEFRALAIELSNRGIDLPLVCKYENATVDHEQYQLEIAADLGGLLIDGLVNGIWVSDEALETALILLQATRARFSRTEFISCPGCGRTLYDIQATVAQIKARFGHLKGLKIGVMGCIVNGIGEMADADYGYVGAGRGKISLYRGKEVVRRSLDQGEALEALKQIIAEDGKWQEP